MGIPKVYSLIFCIHLLSDDYLLIKDREYHSKGLYSIKKSLKSPLPPFLSIIKNEKRQFTSLNKIKSYDIDKTLQLE